MSNPITIGTHVDASPAEMQRDGWQAIPDNYAAFVMRSRI